MNTSTVLCLSCRDAELVRVPTDERWLSCPGCGRGYLASEVERLAQRAEAKARTAEARACFLAETQRPHEPGGSDDKLAVSFLRPLPDESLVKAAPDKRRNVLRIKGLVASSDEVLAAILEILFEVAA